MRNCFVVTAVLTLAVTGCNRNNATNSNLEEGLNHYLSHLQPCPGYTASSFPTNSYAINPRADLEALASVGLLSKSTFLVNGSDQIRYDITDKGRKSTFSGDLPKTGEPKVFCFGRIEVDHITSFTEPAEADGMHVTRVTYTRKLTHRPSWADDPAILKAFRNYAPAGYEDKPQTSGMILTSEGWRLPDDNNR